MTQDGGTTVRPVRVLLQTQKGNITIEVYPDRAPHSAGAFLHCVDGNAYAGASFSRTVRKDNDRGNPPIEVVQAGIADLSKMHPGIPHESTAQTGLRHVDGAISLARATVGTGSPSAFFICVGDQPGLDCGQARNADLQGFATFGRVIAGMDTVRAIHILPTSPDAPDPYLKDQLIREPVAILSARRIDD